jgi:hypothetical protein
MAMIGSLKLRFLGILVFVLSALLTECKLSAAGASFIESENERDIGSSDSSECYGTDEFCSSVVGNNYHSPSHTCGFKNMADVHSSEDNKLTCYQHFSTSSDISDETTEHMIRREYDQLSQMLLHHYQQSLISNVNHQSNKTEEIQSSIMNDPFHYYNQSNVYHVNLSPKIDSSLVRSQHHKQHLLSDDGRDSESDARTNTSSSRSQPQKSSLLFLNVKNLTRIIGVNRIENTVPVQARCTYDQLVRTLLEEYQMIPLVVPEFKSITIGGAIVGGALESSSYQHGQVSDTVTSMMILLPNGTRTIITEPTHPELYHAIPGSYGSLAIILEATIRVRPIPSKFIELHLSTYPSIERGMQALRQYRYRTSDPDSGCADCHNPSDPFQPDFVDAIQYPNGDFVIITGNIQGDHRPTTSPIIHTEDPNSKWFYESVYDIVQAQKHSRNNSNCTSQRRKNCDLDEVPITHIYMPIYDYLFRYERGAFWMGRPTQFSWMTVMKNPFLIGPFLMSWKHTRFLFGRYFTATILYRLLHAIDSTAVAEKFLIQDAYLPSHNASKFVQYIRQRIPITVPIWLCPVRRPLRTQPLSPSGNFDDTNRTESDDILINIGVWGRVDDNNGVRYMEQMEHEMIQYNGRKMLYSITSASQMSYETLYEQHINGNEYWKLRMKYEAHYVLPPIHEKLQLLSRNEIIQNRKRKKNRSWKYWLSRLLT